MRGRDLARLLVAATVCASTAGCFPDYATGGGDAGQQGKPWCQRSAHTFCFDFDQGPLGSAWEEIDMPPPATFTEDSADYTSPPRSGFLQGGGGTGNSSAALGTNLPGGQHLHCEADVRVDVAPPDPMYVMRVDITTTPSDWYHAQLLSDGTLQFDTSSGAGNQTSTPGSWARGGWHRLVLDIALSPAGSDGQAAGVTLVGGIVGSTATLTGPGVSGVAGFGFALGPTNDVPSVLGGAGVRFDDVTCDVSP